MIERVTAKYGAPTAIGDGRMYYFYKAGKVMSVKQKYTPATALEALNAPINPKIAVALNDANGRGSCVAELKRGTGFGETLDKLVPEAKAANCDGLVTVEIFPGITADPCQQGGVHADRLQADRQRRADRLRCFRRRKERGPQQDAAR